MTPARPQFIRTEERGKVANRPPRVDCQSITATLDNIHPLQMMGPIWVLGLGLAKPFGNISRAERTSVRPAKVGTDPEPVP